MLTPPCVKYPVELRMLSRPQTYSGHTENQLGWEGHVERSLQCSETAFRNSQRIFIGGDIWSFEVKAGVNTKSFTKVKPRFTEGTTAPCLSVSLCWWLLLMLSGGLLLVSCFVAAGVQDEGQGVLTYLPLITPPVIKTGSSTVTLPVCLLVLSCSKFC